MKLQVSKSYLLSSLQKTISKEKVKIVGLLTYEEALKVPYNIRTLAINEKVIDQSNEDDTYLSRQVYYKCVKLNPENADEELSEYVLIWDEIIDSTSTTELNITYQLSLTTDINPNSNITISEVIETLKNSLKEKYGEDVSYTIKVTNTSSGSSIDSSTDAILNNAAQTEETLKEAMNTLISMIQLLNTIETATAKLNELNTAGSISSIAEKVDEISVTVDNIYKLVV